MIFEAILIPKVYARLQEIASNFSKFSGGGPQTPAGARFGASPPYHPASKIPGSAPGLTAADMYIYHDNNTATNE